MLSSVELVPLRGEKISSHAHKTGSWYLLGVLFKSFDGHLRVFRMGVPPEKNLRLQKYLTDKKAALHTINSVPTLMSHVDIH